MNPRTDVHLGRSLIIELVIVPVITTGLLLEIHPPYYDCGFVPFLLSLQDQTRGLASIRESTLVSL